MKNLKISLLAGLASFVLSASAFAVSITYDYVGEEFRNDLVPGGSVFYNLAPIDGVDRVRASVTFSGSLAEAILRGDEIFVKRDQTMSRSGEVVWSIGNGKDTLTQDTAFDFDLRMGFKNGGPISGYLGASNTSFSEDGFRKAGDFNIIARPNEPLGLRTSSTAYFNQDVPIGYDYKLMYATGIGRLTTTVNNNASAVPVPAALPLMVSALGLFGITRRRLAPQISVS